MKQQVYEMTYGQIITTILLRNVQVACDAIVTSSDDDPNVNRTTVKAIISGANVYYNFTGNTSCLNLDSGDDIGADMWDYQVPI
jgi:hypothetical protein